DVPLLVLAAQVAPLSAVDYLLQKGAKPNVRAPGGVTPLMAAVSSNRREIVDLLIARGATLSIQNDEGLTAGDLARAYGFQEVASKLRPSSGSSRSKEGAPSLGDGLALGDAAAVSAALARGADANEALENGWTPLMAAAAVGCGACIDALVDADARVMATGKDGYDALAVAA
ncbi:unnamed protein product, partial [Phaeothamnion confervicola]